MNRRDFLKIVGITAATSTAALYGCGSKEGSSEGSKVLGPIPTDKMTYRSFPGLGSDKVSINPEKPDVPLNKNDAFQKVQKRRVQEKR